MSTVSMKLIGIMFLLFVGLLVVADAVSHKNAKGCVEAYMKGHKAGDEITPPSDCPFNTL